MTTTTPWQLTLQYSPILLEELVDEHDESCGAAVSFKGMVRRVNQEKSVSHIVYSCYEELAHHELNELARQISEEFPIHSLRVIHRLGHVNVGECSVWISVQSKHRGEAFTACRALIDRLKATIPIWKQEFYLDQTYSWSRCTASHGHSVIQGQACDQHHHASPN